MGLDSRYIIYRVSRSMWPQEWGSYRNVFGLLRGPQRLPWDPKDGRKLLLGKKHTVVDKMVSHEGKRQNSRSGELSIIHIQGV